jgi:hypothetical protein
VLFAIPLAAAGCGASAPVATAPLEEGRQISPQRFLADSSSAATAIRDFAAILAEVGPVATPARLTAVADRLTDPVDRARLMSQRLSAARLADRRRVTPPLVDVVRAMDSVLAAARSGDSDAAAASRRFAAAVDVLRDRGAPAGK